MLIKNIAKLEDFGIFKNYNNINVKDFGKYNLFYGWNGVGKSTLSDLFRSIQKREPSRNFPSSKFSLILDDGTDITHKNISQSNLNIYTFNQDFIEDNISWDTVAKSILLVDKTRIAERSELDCLKKQRESELNRYKKELGEIKKIEDEISKFGTNAARHLKSSLQSIDTADNYFLNYDKRKFESLAGTLADPLNVERALMSSENLILSTITAKPTQKPTLSFSLPSIRYDNYSRIRDRLNVLLHTNVLNKTIQRLVENNDIKTWVETGLTLHKKHTGSDCEFCGNSITAERASQLEAHFNDEYRSFQNSLLAATGWLREQHIIPIEKPAPTEFYDELYDEYVTASAILDAGIKQINHEISAWSEKLDFKITDALDCTLSVAPVSQDAIDMFVSGASAIQELVRRHNHKSNNFKEETTKAKKRIELHYAATEIRTFDLFAKNNELKRRQRENNSRYAEIIERDGDISRLEYVLSNENIGADQFNACLHKFIGRAELSLRFSSEKKGYEIIRNNETPINGRLSEGEKTAIGFVYFITKLNENSNSVEDSIVVIDDPVSSFDSNHLFHAYSFLKANCSTASQIFVLTHNFTYFKLVRDWFDGINKNRKRKKTHKDDCAFYFTIESEPGLPRTSKIKDADSSLSNYNSEYHYIFSKLHSYINKQKLSRDDSFLTANLSRKLLESFFSFKYPKHRTDFSQLMERASQDSETIDDATKEKIYRFINKYSHNIVIEINEDSAENLTGESHNIVGEIFTWIKEVDKVHYSEMLEVIK